MAMQTVKILCWEEDGAWLGYLQEYPDYWTQGQSLDDLKAHLSDIYADLTSGEIPAVRRVEELSVAGSVQILSGRSRAMAAC